MTLFLLALGFLFLGFFFTRLRHSFLPFGNNIWLVFHIRLGQILPLLPFPLLGLLTEGFLFVTDRQCFLLVFLIRWMRGSLFQPRNINSFRCTCWLYKGLAVKRRKIYRYFIILLYKERKHNFFLIYPNFEYRYWFLKICPCTQYEAILSSLLIKDWLLRTSDMLYTAASTDIYTVNHAYIEGSVTNYM